MARREELDAVFKTFRVDRESGMYALDDVVMHMTGKPRCEAMSIARRMLILDPELGPSCNRLRINNNGRPTTVIKRSGTRALSKDVDCHVKSMDADQRKKFRLMWGVSDPYVEEPSNTLLEGDVLVNRDNANESIRSSMYRDVDVIVGDTTNDVHIEIQRLEAEVKDAKVRLALKVRYIKQLKATV